MCVCLDPYTDCLVCVITMVHNYRWHWSRDCGRTAAPNNDHGWRNGHYDPKLQVTRRRFSWYVCLLHVANVCSIKDLVSQTRVLPQQPLIPQRLPILFWMQALRIIIYSSYKISVAISVHWISTQGSKKGTEGSSEMIKASTLEGHQCSPREFF